MLSKSLSYGGLVTISILALAYFCADKVTLERFGEAVSERLCEAKRGSVDHEPQQRSSLPEELTPIKNVSKDSVINLNSIKGGVYNSKAAIEARVKHMLETCRKYSDVLRPESIANFHIPSVDNFLHDEESTTTLCIIDSVAARSLRNLFERARSISVASVPNKIIRFERHFPKSMKETKRGLVVRHPMERLASTYRRLYAPAYNPVTNQEEETNVSFQDFIQLVVEGPVELSKFFEENHVEDSTEGIDTGMVDGKGQSKNWIPYWKQCGVCHPWFRPHFILHLEHFEEDKKALNDILGNPETIKGWSEVKFPKVASQPELLRFLYSQLTKSEIKAIYNKYRIDHELFGFTPDYFIEMGKDN